MTEITCPLCQWSTFERPENVREVLEAHMKIHDDPWPGDDWTENMCGPDAEGWKEIRKEMGE
jgi:hypothetical protein